MKAATRSDLMNERERWKATSGACLPAGRLKPLRFCNVSARLKPCLPCQPARGRQAGGALTKPIYETSSSEMMGDAN